MHKPDYYHIIKQAWEEMDSMHEVKGIFDVSAHVSTNEVYKVSFHTRKPVFAKLSDYGRFDHFREDHIIINNLANNLEEPYQNFLARALIKRNELFIYRYSNRSNPAWVIFYNPIKVAQKLPRRLEEKQIKKMGRELARFHIACDNIKSQLPASSKTVITDINQLISDVGADKFPASSGHKKLILRQCDIFLNNTDKLNYLTDIKTTPVFVDWNIGNFSVGADGKFCSRWDYDWFRISTRVMDFYFFSRVVSNIGDRTVFSYLPDTIMEDRFIMFLKEYHRIYPLTEPEIRMIGEAYRFFILNYVIKDGRYFFRKMYAEKLQKEAYEIYFNNIDTNINTDKLLKALL